MEQLSSLRLLPFLCLLLSTILPPFSAGDGPLYPTAALPTKSGYLPINSSSGAGELFYAFYEAQQPLSPPSSTPLLLWLQGGPGCSSMIANLFELGPFLLSSSNLLLLPNPFSWNRRFSLLFIDSPLGTGFSPSPSTSSIPRRLHSVASHLFSALQSFLSLNPSLRSRPFFITGESYAGKYIPAIARLILRRNPLLPTSLRINLAGVAIGNGLTHPVSQVRTHAATAYFAGLINDRQRRHLEELQDEAAALALAGDWIAAADARNRVLNWLQNATGLPTLYDLTKSRPYATESLGLFLNREEVKAALGAREGVRWEECGEEVGAALHGDVMRSAKFMVEEVVRGGRMLLYQGIYDLRDGVASTEAWLREMQWEGIGRFLAAERVVWRVDGDLAGYVQRWGNLTHVVVSGAGHLVPGELELEAVMYTPAIDIWSIGCIFAEVLTGKPLFPGKNVVHQLDLMTDLLGTPSMETISRVRNEKARRYLSSMKKKPPISFSDKFPNADPLALKLLERLLAFDPMDRPTAEEALAYPYFKGLAKAEREPSCKPIMKMEFEFERQRVTKEDIRELIFHEILEYHPQLHKDYINGTERTNFLYPSAIEQFRRQFAHLEENGGKSGSVAPLERKHVSLPRPTMVHSTTKPQKELAHHQGAERSSEHLSRVSEVPQRIPVAKQGKTTGLVMPCDNGSIKDPYDPRRLIRTTMLPPQPSLPLAAYGFHRSDGKLGSENGQPADAEREYGGHYKLPQPSLPSKMAPETELDARASPFFISGSSKLDSNERVNGRNANLIPAKFPPFGGIAAAAAASAASTHRKIGPIQFGMPRIY